MAGLLILAAFLACGSGASLATSVVDVTDPLASVAADPLRFGVGAGLMLANCAVVAGIGAAVAVNDVAYHAAMAALGLGSLFLFRLLRRVRAIPGPLAIWGMVGYAALLAGATLELFGVGFGLLLAIPGGLFEFVFAMWLLTRGLAPAPIASPTGGDR